MSRERGRLLGWLLLAISFLTTTAVFEANADNIWSNPTNVDIATKIQEVHTTFYRSILPVSVAGGLGAGAISYAFGGERAVDKVKAGVLGAGVGAGSVALVTTMFNWFK